MKHKRDYKYNYKERQHPLEYKVHECPVVQDLLLMWKYAECFHCSYLNRFINEENKK